MSSTAKLVFDDEFSFLSTRALGASDGTWDTQLWWGPNTTINNEQQYYVDVADNGTSVSGGNNPFSVSNGILSITATPAKSGTSNGQAFNSGVMTTEHSFARTYGYFGMSAQMPAGAGTAPAFWLLSASHQWPPELDVAEEIGRQPTDIVGTAHTGSSNNAYPFFLTTPDVTTGFHTYGVDWQADKITWYFDGEPYGSIATPSDMHSPMYMVVNLAIGGAWPGSPPNPSQLNAAYKIDYVRVWDKFPGATFTAAPLAGQDSATSAIKLDVADSAQVAGSAQVASNSQTAVTTVASLPGSSGPANFTIVDQATGQQSFVSGDKYSGPVQGLSQQLILVTPHNLNITATAPNVFIRTGSGDDAIDVSKVNGNNVLDGGGGSSFLVGGTGSDTFFLDGRGQTSDAYSTVVNFHAGDNITILGVDATNFRLTTQGNQGAASAQGLAYTFSSAGKPNATVVIAGFSTADLTNGRLTTSYGANAATPGVAGSGGSYFNIHGS